MLYPDFLAVLSRAVGLNHPVYIPLSEISFEVLVSF